MCRALGEAARAATEAALGAAGGGGRLSYPKDMYVRRYAELVSELAYEY